MENAFTTSIKAILQKHFGDSADDVFEKSQLLQYINKKTRSANKGSKSRGSFASLYAIYTIVEDYILQGFDKKSGYEEYEGAVFTTLLNRAKSLPFGEKVQNHSYNNRVNFEFKNDFPLTDKSPIVHNSKTKRYWINEHLLKVKIGSETLSIAQAILDVIDEYISAKQDAFARFVQSCEALQKIDNESPEQVEQFVVSLLAPNVDARLFEIVSYAILKFYYHDQHIFWGFERENLTQEQLKLYKTGRTNANDGGIDFVMKPLGRFFQVTETLDFKKYFLDIEKIQKYPITFVIKSEKPSVDLKRKIRENAQKTHPVKAIIDKYMDCIEEIINIPMLVECFNYAVQKGYLSNILDEIVLQSKVEFNYSGNEG